MGYTHYFTRKPNTVIPTEVWQDVLDAKQAILDYHNAIGGCPIQDDSTDGVINLNGVAPDDFETFYIDPDEFGFNFCKTGQRPYDTVVVAILCAIDVLAGPYFAITSDGDRKDWQDGLDLARESIEIQNIPASI